MAGEVTLSAAQLIKLLDLKPLPHEGGYYRETYRAPESLAPAALPPRYSGSRPFSTAIYYLLSPETKSAIHRVASDEVFHFYLGDPVEQLQLLPDGSGRIVTIGPNILAGQHPQVVVPRNVWQGARLRPGGRFALLGTTVAPGFDFADYEQADRAALIAQYPSFRDSIEALTVP